MNLFGISHARYEALVTEHLDGQIDAAGEAKLREHIATCAGCAAEVAEQRAVLAMLHAEPMVEAPRSFALPYAPRTVPVPESRVSRLLRSMQVATAAAALVLVFLVGINIVEGPGALDPTDNAAVMELARGMETDSNPPAKADDVGTLGEGAAPEADAGDNHLVPPRVEESAPSKTFAEPPAAASAGRGALEWALIAMSGFTGILALSIVAATWVPRRHF